MCGFAGIFDPHATLRRDAMETYLGRMTDAIAHRGPDGQGHWTDITKGIGLGFRRLAILDLSAAGDQPMVSACGRYTIVFNGEIYNYRELADSVKATGQFGSQSRGRSDTEVLLSAFTVWGIDVAVTKANGMFGFAVWDKEANRLVLGRDRLGEKPVYYGWAGKLFLFGSELKALKSVPDVRFTVDKEAVSLYFRHSDVPSPYSIYKDVHKLPQGSLLDIDSAGVGTPRAYWSAKHVAESGTRNRFSGTEEEALDAFDELLSSAVKRQMQADVPLGAFLSGGIDSSTLVAVMQAQSHDAIKTFTIGFSESAWDEAGHAKKVAQHLGTDHTELYVSPERAREVIPLLPNIFDEPFADASQIPTYLVSKLARTKVTVSLSGDGGDELFGGYNRYVWGNAFWRRFGAVPPLLRAGMATGIRSLRPKTWDALFRNAEKAFPKDFRWNEPGERMQRLAQVMKVKSSHELYVALTSQFDPPSRVVSDAKEKPTLVTQEESSLAVENLMERMMYFDLVTYLPDDILAKVDRASMAVSLESRAPFLDPGIVEFAWRLPTEWRIQGRETKYLLRQLLYRYIPKKLVERPKMGFSVPVAQWIRGPLRDWAESLLTETRLKQDGYLVASEVRGKWEEHVSGERNWGNHLWVVLMFQAWLDKERR